jgi:hypothetical protein
VKVGDLVRQRFNGRWDDVGLVIDIKQSTYESTRFRDIGMVDVLWCTDQEERKNRRYRIRDLEAVSVS